MFDEVRTILSRQLRVSPDKVTLDAHIKRDLHADSLDILQLLMPSKPFLTRIASFS